MQDENIARDLYFSEGGRGIKASYFAEAGIVPASAEGRNLILPVGGDGSEESVRRLIFGQIQTTMSRGRTSPARIVGRVVDDENPKAEVALRTCRPCFAASTGSRTIRSSKVSLCG